MSWRTREHKKHNFGSKLKLKLVQFFSQEKTKFAKRKCSSKFFLLKPDKNVLRYIWGLLNGATLIKPVRIKNRLKISCISLIGFWKNMWNFCACQETSPLEGWRISEVPFLSFSPCSPGFVSWHWALEVLTTEIFLQCWLDSERHSNAAKMSQLF